MDIVVMVPTYNEAGNVSALITELCALPLDLHVLIVDDNSPDGTCRIVENIAQTNDRVHLLNRTERRGRGWAGIDGFQKALEMGARYIVEMDGDMSHAPKYIFVLRESLKAPGFDVAIGSRYVPGGRDEQRTLLRQLISNFARVYLALVLGVNIKDPTSGYRMFSRSAMENILPHLTARDPFIVSEVLYFLKKTGMKIIEVPIEFMPRGTGESKLKPATLIKYLLRVLKLRLTGKNA